MGDASEALPFQKRQLRDGHCSEFHIKKTIKVYTQPDWQRVHYQDGQHNYLT